MPLVNQALNSPFQKQASTAPPPQNLLDKQENLEKWKWNDYYYKEEKCFHNKSIFEMELIKCKESITPYNVLSAKSYQISQGDECNCTHRKMS